MGPNHRKVSYFLAALLVLLWSDFAQSLMFPLRSAPTAVGVELTYLALFVLTVSILGIGPLFFFFGPLSWC